MPVIVDKPDILCLLEQFINEGNRVIFLEYHQEDLLKLLCEGLERRGLSNVEIWHHIESFTGSGYARYIRAEQMEKVLEIYRMYDFSDKISVFSQSLQYGSLCNYVKNGLLTSEEMVDAVLYKI